jgi:UDP-N-acetylmuramate--alanine ligase
MLIEGFNPSRAMDIIKARKIHIIGIEGAGTSALARLLVAAGKEVGGSDEGDHFYADMLAELGVVVHRRYEAANIPADADLVIYSTAQKPESNPELKCATESGLALLSYSAAVGQYFNSRRGIAVAGSHGKTTTSAWLAFVLDRAGFEPQALIGSKVPQFKGNTLAGTSDLMVLEADEYQNKLRDYRPRGALLNNIDYDHPDFFPDTQSYEQVFIEFMQSIPANGWLAANFDDPRLRALAPVNCRGRVISYAISQAADYVAYGIRAAGDRQIFKVKLGAGDLDEDDSLADAELGEFAIQLSGRHNISNALAVIAASLELGVELRDIRTYLEEFQGTARRAEIMGSYRGALIIDDYAHHPTEVRATLAGLRERYPERKLRVFFHPHTYTRTQALLTDFAASFDSADEAVILDIFGSARERQGTVSAQDLVAAIKAHNQALPARAGGDLDSAGDYLVQSIAGGDLIVLMGAGDVFRIGRKILDL